ncbi:MAG TPA: hypothetical protein VGL97_16350 [Bryobacteraceae bacterium]
MLCIEILSPEDGVVDPADKTTWIYLKGGMQEANGESVTLAGTSSEIPFFEIFD